jgi:signal transduction histidine kinase
MSITNEQHLEILMQMKRAFAFHRCLFDENGVAIDDVILEINPCFEKITGLKKTDIIGKNITELSCNIEIAKPSIIKAFGEITKLGEEKKIDIYLKSTKKWYAVSIYSPIQDHFCTLFEDITNLYQIRKEFDLTNRQLIEKNKELEQIVFVTSHDLRSPLVNIQGFTRKLEMSLDELKHILKKIEIPNEILQEIQLITDDELPEAMNFIKSGINKMDSLQKGLLSISRLGRIHPEIRMLDMNALVQEVTMNFEYKVKELDIKISTMNLPGCLGDISLMNQIFSNLLENAIKYRDINRRCIISIEGEKTKDCVTYKITDNGIGIKKENHEKIFKIFYRDKR